jgi:hypothetical protein
LHFRPPRVFTVKELVQEGAAVLMSNRAALTDFPDDDRRAIDDMTLWRISTHLTDSHRGNDWPDLSESGRSLADDADDENLFGDDPFVTRPDDILFSTRRHIFAVVDERGGYIPVGSVECLRVDNAQLDPHYVAYCLTGQWNKRFMRGSKVNLRADIRELEVPVLPMTDQRLVLAVLNHTRDLSRKAREAAGAADRVATAVLDVVRYGATTDDRPPVEQDH